MGGISQLGRDVGDAGDRSSRQGKARGPTVRGGTSAGLEPGTGDRGMLGRPDRHWCRHRQFLAEPRWLLSAGFRASRLAAPRSVRLAGFQPLPPAESQSRRCTSAARPGASPRPGSGCQGRTEGHSVVAAAKRRCVMVADAKRRNPTGGFEENNPSTRLADGAGELLAESRDGAADDFQHPVADDLQHPPPESSRADHPGVAKSTRASASSRSSSGFSPASQACRPCFGRGCPAEFRAGIWRQIKLARSRPCDGLPASRRDSVTLTQNRSSVARLPPGRRDGSSRPGQ
jgi:hypothetical protein